MRRTRRYAVAVLVGAAVTAGVAVGTPNPLRELILLLAVALTYTVGTAVALRYPEAIRSDGNWASAAFTGVLTFGGLILLQGVDGGQNLAVGVLGWGLAAFGFVAGMAFERERDGADTDARADTDPTASSD